MFSELARLAALMASFLLLHVGHGGLAALVVQQGSKYEFSDSFLGLLTSVTYVGFFAGSYLMRYLLPRISYIRTFSVCAAVLAVWVLFMPLFPNEAGWVVLRLLYGVFFSTIIVICDGWMNSAANNQNRSRIYAANSDPRLCRAGRQPVHFNSRRDAGDGDFFDCVDGDYFVAGAGLLNAVSGAASRRSKKGERRAADIRRRLSRRTGVVCRAVRRRHDNGGFVAVCPLRRGGDGLAGSGVVVGDAVFCQRCRLAVARRLDFRPRQGPARRDGRRLFRFCVV